MNTYTNQQITHEREEILTGIDQIAKFLGLSRSGTAQLLAAGAIPAKKVGLPGRRGRWLASRGALRSWIEQSQDEPPQYRRGPGRPRKQPAVGGAS